MAKFENNVERFLKPDELLVGCITYIACKTFPVYPLYVLPWELQDAMNLLNLLGIVDS